VQKVRPATVQITNEQATFDTFSDETVPAGVGTGVIYDKDGHIITNNHVVEGASKLMAALPDGRSFEAKLIGTDPRTDIAVVQIQASDLPIANLGDSSKTAVGDWAIAVGNALGLPGGPTVTFGVVSALDRSALEPSSSSPNQGNPNQGGRPSSSAGGPQLFGLIQTDAAINPGNSGGPLANSNGDVIGINTLVAGEAEPGLQAQGIGFAININTAKRIADELVKNGSVQHAYLGVNYVPLTPAIANQIGTNAKNGIAVARVLPGSPAAQAGLQTKDVITQVNGKDLKGESDLAQQVDGFKPGDQVTLTVVRGNQPQQIKVTLGKAPNS
jgi:S1-C subfamily serine protease